jgi:alpha-ribazole phosphatase/probable phosphoglycerate mutase
MEAEQTIIDVIRHGEPVGGVLIRGQRNDPLSDTGWQQMRGAVEGCAGWQRIITSPLLRCAEFARELAGRLAIPVSEEAAVAEIGFGQWEGANPADLLTQQPQAYHAFWENPADFSPPGGEPLAQFEARVVAALRTVIEKHCGEHLLIVAHGGVIRMMIAHVLGMPPRNLFRMDVPYAGISRILVERGVPRLNFHCGRPMA